MNYARSAWTRHFQHEGSTPSTSTATLPRHLGRVCLEEKMNMAKPLVTNETLLLLQDESNYLHLQEVESSLSLSVGTCEGHETFHMMSQTQVAQLHATLGATLANWPSITPG